MKPGHLSGVLALSLVMLACYPAPPGVAPNPDGSIEWPRHFPTITLTGDDAPTAERIALGKRLFFEKALSRDSTVSCASCHRQSLAFTDGVAKSIGIQGRMAARNSPTLANLAWNTSFFWDGGAPSLELQVLGPIENENEMGSSVSLVLARLAADVSYVADFQKAYGRAPDAYSLTRALAAYERSLISATSPYDDFVTGRNPARFSAAARRGMELFFGEKAECFHCHSGNLLSDFSFQNNGLYASYPDEGRARITFFSTDIGKFKVPSLRNVAVTAPYMHDGSLPTLDDVIAHYKRGGNGHPNQSPLVRRFTLTPQERADLKAFLESLTDMAFLTNTQHQP